MDSPETIPTVPSHSERAARWFTTEALPPLRRAAVPLAVLAALGVGVHWLSNQRVEIPRGEQLLRRNTWTDGVDVLPEGSAWVLPGVHTARQLPARDLTLRATRLANPGTIPLEIIEVQSGRYLGEDDIVRFEDTYGRTNA